MGKGGGLWGRPLAAVAALLLAATPLAMGPGASAQSNLVVNNSGVDGNTSGWGPMPSGWGPLTSQVVDGAWWLDWVSPTVHSPNTGTAWYSYALGNSVSAGEQVTCGFEAMGSGSIFIDLWNGTSDNISAPVALSSTPQMFTKTVTIAGGHWAAVPQVEVRYAGDPGTVQVYFNDVTCAPGSSVHLVASTPMRVPATTINLVGTPSGAGYSTAGWGPVPAGWGTLTPTIVNHAWWLDWSSTNVQSHSPAPGSAWYSYVLGNGYGVTPGEQLSCGFEAMGSGTIQLNVWTGQANHAGPMVQLSSTPHVFMETVTVDSTPWAAPPQVQVLYQNQTGNLNIYYNDVTCQPGATVQLVPSVPAAEVLSVSPGGTDTGNCVASACKTIAYALGQAQMGDIVTVAPGTYPGPVLVTKDVTLQSPTPGGAIIDATGAQNGILVQGQAASGATVEGFAVQGASGAGIAADQTSDVQILDNLPSGNAWGINLNGVSTGQVESNMVSGNGGGIRLSDTMGATEGNVLAYNMVTNNTKHSGISLTATNPQGLGGTAGGIFDNEILQNTVSGNAGAGVTLATTGAGTVVRDTLVLDNTISGNAGPGVALNCPQAGASQNVNLIEDNTLSSNGSAGDAAAGLHTTAGISLYSPTTDVTVIVANNNDSGEADAVYTSGLIQVIG